MESTSITNKIEIKPLTSLRFFAAAGVIYGHFGYAFNTAGLGVTFFFMLSGFILTYSYYDIFKSFNLRIIKNMWASRAARIYPVHLVTLLFSIPLIFTEGNQLTNGSFLENALLLQAWYPNHIRVFSYNSVSWTLSNELFFYLMFPLILIVMKKLRMRSKTLVSLTGLFACIIFTAAIMHIFKPIPYSTPYSWRWWLILISPYLNILTFLSGVFLAFIHHRIINEKPTLSYAQCGFLEVAILVLSIIYFLLTFKNIAFNSIFFMYGIPLSAIILIFSLQRGIISKILSLRPITYLGEISFSIYMVHQVTIRYIENYVGNVVGVSDDPKQIIAQIGTSAIIVLVSAVIYRTIESPARMTIRKLSLR